MSGVPLWLPGGALGLGPFYGGVVNGMRVLHYLTTVADEHPDRLIAQCIPLNPELWRVESYAEFLHARRDLLAAAINDLIDDPV